MVPIIALLIFMGPFSYASPNSPADGLNLARVRGPGERDLTEVVLSTVERGNARVSRLNRSEGAAALCTVPTGPSAQSGLSMLREDPVSESQICFPDARSAETLRDFLKEADQAATRLPESSPARLSTGATPNPQRVERFTFFHENDMDVPRHLLSGRISDDVGRTMGLSGRYESEDDQGIQWIELKSEGFGQRARVNGASRDATGRWFLKFHDVERLKAGTGLKLPRQNFNTQDMALIEVEFESKTNNSRGSVAQQVQGAWHSALHNGQLEYNYVDHGDTTNFATLKAGFRRVVTGEFAGFHCMAAGQALLGVDTQGRAVAQTRVEGRVTTGARGGRTADNPWLALSAWHDNLVRTNGSVSGDNRAETGVKLESSHRISPNVVVRPFYGYVYYVSRADRIYSVGSPQGREPMTVFGVTVVREFQ
jgi:hypothetical protein